MPKLAEQTAQQLDPLTQNSFGDRYLFRINRGTFEKVSAYALYEAQFSDVLFKPTQLSIIIGTDSGLLPRYLVQKGLANGARYLFIEPDEVLDALNAQQLLADLPPEICCTTLSQWEAQAATFKIGDYFYISAVHSHNSLCAQAATLDDYPELSWLVTEKLSQYHWHFCMSLGSETFVVRQLNNLADNLLPAKQLAGAFKGLTAVIMAGGPSLDAALPWIKQHRDQFVLFAVSRIARQLLQHQVEPDFIFSVDPTELSFDISKEMLTFSRKPIFIYAYHTISTLVNQWPGTGFYLGERLPWKSPLNIPNLSGAGPTVTNTALSTAHAFGFKRIILTGVDLCFTRDGYTHAKGSNEAQAGPRFNLTSLQIETNNGELAPTSCDFLTAIKSLALQAVSINKSDCTIINPAPSAAKITGIHFQPLNEIEFNEPSPKNTSNINSLIAQAQQKSQQDFGLMRSELQKAEHQIKAILILAEQALAVNERMYNADGIITNYKDKRQLDKIEQKLKRQYRIFSVMVKHFGIRQFIKMTKPFDDNDLSPEEAKSLCAIYYQAYRDGAKTLLSLINNSLDRISSRQSEQQPHPEFAKLIEQWQRDQSFGRAHHWLNKPDHLADNDREALQDCVKKFEAIIADQNTQHRAQTRNHSSLKTFKNRAKLLFKHSKVSELQDLKNGLEQHPDLAAATEYLHLATAYIADLQSDYPTALSAYHRIIDGGETSLFEDALIRIADISLKTEDHQNSYLALQCLAQLSPLHLPLFAEINRLMGDPQAAIAAYCDYINQFPNDTVAQLKLAALQIEIKAYAAAAELLDYILMLNPAASAALALKKQLPAANPQPLSA